MAKTLIGNVKGPPGVTPHIGENGNWWIGETDTGVAATAGAEAAMAAAAAAKTSETNAKTSETNAGNSATAAANSASKAATSETNAANSASSANSSKTAAASSATTAENAANEAKGYRDEVKDMLDNAEVDPANAVLVIEQTLTEVQKAQARENIGALEKNQGTANVGKILVVGADGNLALTDMPEGGSSGDVIGMIDANNNIVITGDLADGTYVFKYENADGTYANIGSLVVGGVVQYAITTNLTNCTGASGNAKVIEENGAVTLTFTANDGYALTETVTVSGAVYTWNATTGALVLSNPTADVVITIVATKSGYTNIIDTVGYKDNIRLSSSDGVSERDATGYTTTGLIEVPAGGVLRTRGVAFNSTTYSSALLYIYTYSTGAFASAQKYGVTISGYSMTVDANNNVTITCSHNSKLRLVGYGSGADLIVTINEEITD